MTTYTTASNATRAAKRIYGPDLASSGVCIVDTREGFEIMTQEADELAQIAPADQAAAVTDVPKAAKPTRTKAPKASARVVRADGLVEGTALARLLDHARQHPSTHPELCHLVGWGQCLPALRKVAARAGLRLVTTKAEGQLTRYQAV